MFNLSEAMKALEGREEFAVKKLDGKVVVNYLIQLPDSFEGIRANFRGVVLDESSGEIVSLPLHKFYNVGQRPETQVGLIGHLKCLVLDKLDGTMCHALEVGGDIVLASRMGWDTEQAKAATKLLLTLPPAYRDEVSRVVRAGATPIFEYVGPNNPVVVQYAKEDLIYLWSRDRKSGEYSRNDLLAGLSRDICHGHSTVNEVMSQVVSLENEEGRVVVCENGLWVKAKCPWYLERHRVVDLLMKPTYRIYEVALAGKLDDVIGQAAELYRARLQEILAEVSKDQLHLLRALQQEYEALLAGTPRGVSDHERRKAFALAAKASPSFSGLMSLYSGKPGDGWVNARLFDNYKAKYPGRLFTTLPDEP